MRLLIVEDDVVIAERLKTGLVKERFQVDLAYDGRTGLDMALTNPYAAVILDLMLPEMNGLAVCKSLRARKRAVPILMLTARDEVDDKVLGLECGADDYLPKPFDFRELLARVNALIRRDQIHKGKEIRIADLVIDSSSRTVTRSGQVLKLTGHEYELLEALARNEGRTLTREVVLASVWGGTDSFSNVVDHHIASLRKKVDAGRTPKLIQTAHGFGYVLRANEENV